MIKILHDPTYGYVSMYVCIIIRYTYIYIHGCCQQAAFTRNKFLSRNVRGTIAAHVSDNKLIWREKRKERERERERKRWRERERETDSKSERVGERERVRK